MAKDRDERSIEEKLEEWLQKEGYAVEYATMHALRRHGVMSHMGDHLPGSDKTVREIDVTAFAVDNSDSAQPFVVRVLCECKYSVDRPWVVMPSILPNAPMIDWMSLPHSQNTESIYDAFLEDPSLIEDLWHFSTDVTHGHNLIQAFRSENQDYAYGSLRKVTDVAWNWATTSSGPNSRLICIPAIVLKGQLFEAHCPEGSERFQTQEKHSCRVLWTGSGKSTVVDVVTHHGLDAWAANIRQLIDTLTRIAVKVPYRCD